MTTEKIADVVPFVKAALKDKDYTQAITLLDRLTDLQQAKVLNPANHWLTRDEIWLIDMHS